MADKARLLKVKAYLKRRQPVFLRQGAHKHKRVKKAWRSPKGLHSKMRDSRRGYKVKLQQGYHTPLEVRGMDRNGLYPTVVSVVKQLEGLDPKVHSVIVAGGLGARKRILILEAAAAKKFTLLNSAPGAAESLKAKFASRAAASKAREASKAAKQKSLEEKAESAAKDSDKKKPEAESGDKSGDKSDETKKVEERTTDIHEHKPHDHKEHEHKHESTKKDEDAKRAE